MRAIALLAYTNGWDGFINLQTRGRRDYLTPVSLPPFSPAGVASYAAVYAFFAPLDELTLLVNAPVDIKDILIHLPLSVPGIRKIYWGACTLPIYINGVNELWTCLLYTSPSPRD